MISQVKTKYLQGIAIILMIIHHYMIFISAQTPYINILPLSNTIITYFGWFGKICVVLFLICSGIGIYYKSSIVNDRDLKKYCFKKSYHLYCLYLLILIIFMPYIHYLLNYEIKRKTLLLHILTLNSNYNSAWWFLNTYLIILVLFPFFKLFLNKKYSLAYSFFLLVFAYICNYIDTKYSYNFISGSIQQSIYLFCTCQFSFCVGYNYAKFYNKIRFNHQSNILFLVSLFVSFIIRGILQTYGLTNIFTDTIIMIPVIFFLPNDNFMCQRLMLFFGKYCTELWLIHMFPLMLIRKLFLNQITIVVGLPLVISLSFICSFALIRFNKMIKSIVKIKPKI